MSTILKTFLSGSKRQSSSLAEQTRHYLTTHRKVEPENVETSLTRPYTIVVEGNIASGKTTLLESFAKNHVDKVILFMSFWQQKLTNLLIVN